MLLLHEDEHILVIHKPAGLLTVGTGREQDRTVFVIIANYLRKSQPKSRKKIFLVHRLDRETSGVLVVAKSEQAKVCLQQKWKGTEKTYQAVVEGHCKKKSDTITSYLAENSAHVVYSTPDRKKGKLSHTAYTVLRQAKDCALLEIKLLTGRKNQIRVHLADIGHPIVGDKKYGNGGRGRWQLALHAKSISFTHPTTGERLYFEAEVPPFFEHLLNRGRHSPERNY